MQIRIIERIRNNGREKQQAEGEAGEDDWGGGEMPEASAEKEELTREQGRPFLLANAPTGLTTD